MIRQRDKVFGCYLGAAIGDALGGPVQAFHARRIREELGGLNDMREYRQPPGFFEPGPGYALRSQKGCVTDETFVRAQFAEFAIKHSQSRNLIEMIDHINRYADLTRWPPEMLEPLERIRRGETPPEMAGEAHKPGGALGWWTPIGIVNIAKPQKAAAEMTRLSAVWKRPAEQDLLAAVQAGVAHALTPRATVETVVEAAKEHVGSLTRSLIDRAVAVGRSVKRGEDEQFVDRCYETLLVNVAPNGVDDRVPPSAPAESDISKPCGSPLLAETVPLAFAALVFGDGRSRATLLAAAALGRDAKAICSTAGAWIGALVGRARLPREWMGWVIAANHDDVDLVTQANALADEVEPKLEL